MSSNAAGENEGKGQPQAAPNQSSQSDVCFVMSPFGGYFDAYYRDIFSGAIEAAELKPERADSLFRPSNIVHDIWHLVTICRVGLADLTGKNPNVFYELGLAHAANKPILLVTQDIEDVPFDLRALRVISYDVRHPKWGSLLGEQITQGLQETIRAPQQAVLPTFLRERPEEGPTVDAGEKRFRELEQQIDTLRAQFRSFEPKLQPDRTTTVINMPSSSTEVADYLVQHAMDQLSLQFSSVDIRHAEDDELLDRMARVLRDFRNTYTLGTTELRATISLALTRLCEISWDFRGIGRLDHILHLAVLRRDTFHSPRRAEPPHSRQRNPG